MLVDPKTGRHVRLSHELDLEHSQAVSRFRLACDHPKHERRADGNAEVDQCLVCGARFGGAYKRSPGFAGLPKFDREARERWELAQNAARNSVDAEFIARQAALDAALPDGPGESDFQYAAYLRTPEWQRRRALVLHRAGGTCEGCLSAPATEVHHRIYDRVGNELLFDLVAVCRKCHLRAHPEHAELEEFYEDYSECANCRFGDGEGGTYCLKFETPVFKAFSAGGGCSPPGSAREGLR
jgi:hypothetical protein